MAQRTSLTTPLVPPIELSAVYRLRDTDDADAIYTGQAEGTIYARDGHPNADQLAEQLNQLHAAVGGVVTSSGMAAISATLLTLLKSGDFLLASDQLYGKTGVLFRNELTRLGIASAFVDTCDLNAVEAALVECKPKILFVETITNPLVRVCDLPALSTLCQRHSVSLIVDNTFATPILCRPLEMGAAIVVESLTKMLAGHSDVTLGYVGCSNQELAKQIMRTTTTWGFLGNPFESWLTMRGLETLQLRMTAACANAVAVAHFLSEQPAVTMVCHPSLPDHPDHARAKQFYNNRFGNMLSFTLKDGRDAVNRFMHAATGIPFCPSLGHTSTTCSHPDTTSHRNELPARKQALRIVPGMVRLSVGCEPIETIIAELERGLYEPEA